MLTSKRILLIVSGGIAAYKTPDLVRRLKKAGADVRCVLTAGGAEFVTPLALQSVSGNEVFADLFSLTQENEMGHIELSRHADVVLVAPATANILAKMTHGLADDLASTLLLATDKPVLVAPAMNVRMWDHPATQDNVTILKARGVTLIGPDSGEMACGDWGEGRMSDADEIVLSIANFLKCHAPLSGKHAIVTSGPTLEPIDPVRFIANRSSGKQGHAIASALRDLGCAVTYICGPVDLKPPSGVALVNVESAKDMQDAVIQAVPCDIAVCAAAVSDWRVEDMAVQKIKKTKDAKTPHLNLVENPDILQSLSQPGPNRPALVIGFAAETENVVENARLKLARKGCDWIIANDVSGEQTPFGNDQNAVHFITRTVVEDWPLQSKNDVGKHLAARISDYILSPKRKVKHKGKNKGKNKGKDQDT